MADPSSWDLLDEDCSNISDWDNEDISPAVSEVSPAGQFRMDTNNGKLNNAAARRWRVLASAPNVYTLEVKLYHDNIGVLLLTNHFKVGFNQDNRRFRACFTSQGLLISDTGSGDTEVGDNLVKEAGDAELQTWRFLVTFTATVSDGTCDVYLDDSTHSWEKVGTAIPCSREMEGTDGQVRLAQAGFGANNMVTHVDYIKIASGLYAPGGPASLKSVDGVLKANILSIGGAAIGDIKSVGGIE